MTFLMINDETDDDDDDDYVQVLSILLKNPHHHSLPHAVIKVFCYHDQNDDSYQIYSFLVLDHIYENLQVPVHLLNDTYNVVGFDGSTTIAELLATLCGDLGVSHRSKRTGSNEYSLTASRALSIIS